MPRFIAHRTGYPEVRNVLKLHGSDCIYLAWNATRILRYLSRLVRLNGIFWEFAYFHLGKRRILHTFNGINFLRGDYIVTFESDLPRGWEKFAAWQLRLTLRRLASSDCKLLIAISHRAYKLQVDSLSRFLSQGFISRIEFERIKDKLFISLPPQEPSVLTNEFPTIREAGDPLRVCFVGNLFFLKGGREMIKSLINVRKAGLDVELTVVSTLEVDDWYSRTTERDRLEWMEILLTSQWISLHDSIPNAMVLNLLRQCDLALFLSKRDSFGYFVLEAQSCGVPVISTELGVMREINRSGWTVKVGVTRGDEIDKILIKEVESILLSPSFESERRTKSSQDRKSVV